MSLGATIKDMLAAKLAQTSYQPVTQQQHKETNAQRKTELERLRVLADKEAKRREMMGQRQDIINERNTVAYKMVQCQVVRKDGRNVAKSGQATVRNELRNSLAAINHRLDAINAQLSIGQPSMHPAAVSRRNNDARNTAIALCRTGHDCTERSIATKRAMALAKVCRPERGYPAPPFRRADTYPSNAMMKAPKTGLDVTNMRAEHDRLAECIATLLDIEGESPRVVRMFNHLDRLDSRITMMLSNPTIRKRPGTKEYEIKVA